MNTYLGDSVYASDELNLGCITLTTNSHKPEEAKNIIHLEPEVYKALVTFINHQEREQLDRRAKVLIDKIPEALRYKAEIYSSDQIDVNHLEHDEALEVMRALNAGRWTRKESGVGGKLDYSTTIDGWTVRLWAAGPPDSCRVVEEEYEIPASKGIRKRIICHKTAESESIPAPDPTTAWPDHDSVPPDNTEL